MDDVKEVDRDDDLLDNWNAKQVRGMVDMVSSSPYSFIGIGVVVVMLDCQRLCRFVSEQESGAS